MSRPPSPGARRACHVLEGREPEGIDPAERSAGASPNRIFRTRPTAAPVKGQGLEVDANLAQARHAAAAERVNAVEADARGGTREPSAPRQGRAAGSPSGAARTIRVQLAPSAVRTATVLSTGGRARQQQIRHIDACDEQHDRHGRAGPGIRSDSADIADDLLLQRHHAEREAAARRVDGRDARVRSCAVRPIHGRLRLSRRSPPASACRRCCSPRGCGRCCIGGEREGHDDSACSAPPSVGITSRGDSKRAERRTPITGRAAVQHQRPADDVRIATHTVAPTSRVRAPRCAARARDGVLSVKRRPSAARAPSIGSRLRHAGSCRPAPARPRP